LFGVFVSSLIALKNSFKLQHLMSLSSLNTWYKKLTQFNLPKLIFWSLGFLWGEGRLDVV
jgi:hypothetical protein